MGEYTRLEIRTITVKEATNRAKNKIKLVLRRTVIFPKMTDFGIVSIKVQSWIPLMEVPA
ncbi:hypothetical protein D3C74_323600 [compost metagenome]